MNENYLLVKERIADRVHACGRSLEDVNLVVVSKMRSLPEIESVYALGCRDFGENRIQEALQKIPHLKSDICWHLIGSLQRNKVNKAIEQFDLIHSVDTPELAKAISIHSESKEKITRILLQVNTSGELSKHGLTPEQWRSHLDEINALSHVQLEGLMTIAPLTDDQTIIYHCFASLRALRDEFKTAVKDPLLFHHLSMGMSHDYEIAIEEGATILRIGSAIFS